MAVSEIEALCLNLTYPSRDDEKVAGIERPFPQLAGPEPEPDRNQVNKNPN